MSDNSRDHRPDIDGLRALAILPVVLFHVGAPGFSGGFVGVDVFFVISGFLITTLLTSDLNEGAFSLTRFYARRARRILPALFVMAACTALAGVVLMTPGDLTALGRDMTATGLFVSNLQLARETGYFAPNADTIPLLHTWSLAIEEQFYALWPFVLWGMWRLAPHRRAWVLVGLGLASFGLAAWWVGHDAADAFFMTPTRVWELMLGAAVALWSPATDRPWLRQTLAAAGLAMIGWSVFTFSAATPSPGPMLLLPCLGAALCIVANRHGDTLVARALSWRPVVFIGLISYSLYLWHWPLLVFTTYRLMGPPSPLVAAGVVVASLVVAVLSWRFIEQPFRRRGAEAPGRTLIVAGVSVGLLALAGGVLWLSSGLPVRADSETRAADAARLDRSPFDICGPPPTNPRCRSGPPGPEKAAIWGDSHAVAFTPAVARAADRAGLGLRLYTRGACPPLLGVVRVQFGVRATGCTESNARVLASIAATPSIRTVVLVSRWAAYAETTPSGLDGTHGMFLVDDRDGSLTRANSRRVFADSLEATITTVMAALGPGGRIILVEQPPELPFSAPDCFSRRGLWGLSTAPCEGVDRASVDRRLAFVRGQLRAAAARHPGVTVYSLRDRLCSGDRCLTRRGQIHLYVDDDHLSRAGALAVAGDFSLAPESGAAAATGERRQ